MNKNIIFKVNIIFSLLLCLEPFAQSTNDFKFVTVTPGQQYEAGSFHNFWFGKHWRDIWTTPISVPVLDMEIFAGGLSPEKKGGGLQTNSIRLRGNDGNIYKFRSIQKDPTKVLEEELQESVVADVLQDQISSANPFGALVVVPLLNAVNVLQAEPVLVVMPADESLGEFREEFSGMLGMIELHPEAGESEGEFEAAEKVLGTYKLFHRLEEKRDEQVDAIEFLKARLMDNYVGDWDRHTDQWRWAKYRIDGKELWRPVPRDRDQAFPKYDGVFPSIAQLFVLQLNHFDYEFPKARNLSWSGRVLDRRYLSEISKPVWDSVTVIIQKSLTDSVIDDAVSRLPKEINQKDKDELLSKLKSRRRLLRGFSEDYYKLINDVVDIYCSSKDDFVEVSRLNNDETEISYFKRDKDTGDKKGEMLYHKVFDNELTSEFRIYMMEGDDKIVIYGEVDSGPLVKVIGGEGKDEFVDNSKVNGYLFCFTPIPNAERAVIFYDSGKKSDFKKGSGSVIDTDEMIEPKNDTEKYEPTFKERYHEIEFSPVYGFSTDDGLTLGGGPTYIVYDYLMDPYEYRTTLTASYSFKLKSYNLYYGLISKSWIKNAETNIEAGYSQVALVRYYGFGNETSFDKDLEAGGFYDLKQNLFFIKPSIDFHLFKHNTLNVRISYNALRTEMNNEILLTDFHNPGYGLGYFKLIESGFSFLIDSRDVERNPESGYLVVVHGSVFPKVLDNEQWFYKAGFDLRSFFSGKMLMNYTLALRTSGEGVIGSKYPFQFAAFRGGKENLRGYSRERFAGDAALSAQAELRFIISKFNIYLPGQFGVHFFGETGRVFVEGDNSSRWHPAYGGGVWLSLINRMLNTSFTVGISPEKTSFYLRARLGF
ncbi:MAG TPA: BamA/TamA family outer membrane protein [Ignavibacteriaceae bacterium]|nr:BamA/TamA family outer membrane protein [Ignavibacteriaceae bacterium]